MTVDYVNRPESTYPAEPWHLVGQLHTSVFLLDAASAARATATRLPSGWRALRVGGRSIGATAWVSYEVGSVLEYSELMSVVLVRRGWRILPSITHIWVDSAASCAGGRALWGIPKEMARFVVEDTEWQASQAEQTIARGSIRARRRIPGRLPLRFRVVQLRGGAAKITQVRATARLSLDTAEFHASSRGRLGFLTGRRPLVNLSMNDFVMTFGAGLDASSR